MANAIATRTIDVPVFTVSVAEFVKNEAEKDCFEKTKVDNYQNASKKAIVGHETKVKGKLQPKRWTCQDHRVPGGYSRQKKEPEGVQYRYVF